MVNASGVGVAGAGRPEPWRPPALDGPLVTAYLTRLGLDPAAERAAGPSATQLRRLHAAHVERVAYETLWIALGERRGIDPVESARQVVAGRGGYCYHLNGAFSTLLTALGYRMTWHRAGVQGRSSPTPPGDDGNHLALSTVLDGRAWWVDVGLGDGPLEPVPLAPATFGPGDAFRLRPSDVVPGGWRFDHEPDGAFTGMDFSSGAASPVDLADRHVEMSTSPESGFVRVVTAQHRTPTTVRILRGKLLTERPGSAPGRQLSGYAEWRALLRDEFRLALDDVPEGRLRDLWRRIVADHAEWERAEADRAAAERAATERAGRP
ncbi:arylamine N-acetyltransferase [Plantactinospora sp. GCM10030261]|uniref:arylamine N-acetyltransferase family protein n=1 Tax=Plantactinospora sp. GCM10030261 TaxID=3273420 RepID=UPI003613D3B6